jgi:tetratricopeptide (TPR) repeat protein
MQVLEPAVAAGLLIEDGSWDYRFAHALVRETLYAALTRLERARLHLRVGEAFEAMDAARTPEGVTRLAYHFGLSARIGGSEPAVRYAGLAARHATAQHAHDRAVQYWEQALAAAGAERYPLLIELGRARRRAGDLGRARTDLQEAIAAATRAGDTAAAVDAATVFGGFTVWILRPYGVVDDALVTVLSGLLDRPLAGAERAAILGTLGPELYYGPRRAEGRRYTTEAVELARRTADVTLLAQTLNNRLLAYWEPEHEALRRSLAEEMLALPGLPRTAEVVARAHRMSCLIRAGEIAAYDADLARCRDLVAETGRPDLDGVVMAAEMSRVSLGRDWDKLAALAERFRDAHAGTSLWGHHFTSLIALYTARRGQGRAAEMVDDLVARAGDPAFVPLRPIAVLAAAEAGDEVRARQLIARWGTAIPHDWSTDFAVPVWALVAARLGVPDPAALLDALRRMRTG